MIFPVSHPPDLSTHHNPLRRFLLRQFALICGSDKSPPQQPLGWQEDYDHQDPPEQAKENVHETATNIDAALHSLSHLTKTKIRTAERNETPDKPIKGLIHGVTQKSRRNKSRKVLHLAVGPRAFFGRKKVMLILTGCR